MSHTAIHTQQQHQSEQTEGRETWYWHPYARASMFVVAFFCFFIGLGIFNTPIQLEPIMQSYFPYLFIEGNSIWFQLFGLLVWIFIAFNVLLFVWIAVGLFFKRLPQPPLNLIRGTSNMLKYLNARTLKSIAYFLDRVISALIIAAIIQMLASTLPTWSDGIEKSASFFLVSLLILNASIPPNKPILFARKVK